MSVESTVRAVTTYRLTEMKQRGEKIAMLTSYDYSMAKIVDAAGIDVILVGDSAANVMAGYETTVPITLDMMIYHARSVVRAVERALVVVDLPFGTYQGNSKVALDSAIRIMKETEADAVKMEGGEEILESVQRILSAGIPVMGHRGAGRARDRRDSDPDDRHRRRRGLRRPGARDPRHAGYQQRVLAALPAPLRRPAHGDDRCRGAVCQGCEGVRFPQRKGAVLVPDSLYTQAPAGTFQPGLALQKAKEGYLIVLCRAS